MLTLGTRGSDLALYQAHYIKKLLDPHLPNPIEISIIRTHGDQKTELPFHQMNAKGIFTKEIEEALLQRKIDLAVHSLKDLATDIPKELCIVAIPERAAPNDLLIIRQESCLPQEKRQYPWVFREGAIIGTSAIRRMSLLQHYRPDVQIKNIRGNVPTRLKKLQEKECDAILLAQAGIDRLQLDLSPYEVCALHPKYFPPSPGQGALAVQTRSEDEAMNTLIAKVLHHAETAQMIRAERLFLEWFEGGCSLPLGAFAQRLPTGKIELLGFLEKTEKRLFGRSEADTAEQAAQQLYLDFQNQLANHM